MHLVVTLFIYRSRKNAKNEKNKIFLRMRIFVRENEKKLKALNNRNLEQGWEKILKSKCVLNSDSFIIIKINIGFF